MSRRKRPPAEPEERLVPGMRVACPQNGKLRGVDPFTTLVVVEVNRDGTVDLARLGGGPKEWHHVNPADLVGID